jgi:hypothetical protein
MPPRAAPSDPRCSGKEKSAFTEALLKPQKTSSGLARFHFRDERAFVRSEGADVHVMATSAEASSTVEAIALALYPDCIMTRDDLALDALSFSPGAAPSTLTLNRSSCEAIFPTDLAAKLVSFGNAARLGRGVSVCCSHWG